MAFSRNRLGTSNSDIATCELEARVMLAATRLTRAATGQDSIPEDGFGRISSVGDTGIAAANNAWNGGFIPAGQRLLGEAEQSGDLATLSVARSPAGPIRDTSGAPYGFPTLLVGSANGIESEFNPFSEGNQNGVPQDEIESIPITFNSNGGATGVDGAYNTTLDVWFGQRETADGRDVPSALLMLQNYNSNIADGTTQGRPAGSRIAQGERFEGINGTYDIWFGPNAGTEEEGGVPVDVISYVRTDDQTDGRQQTRGDLNALIQDASTRRKPGRNQTSTLLNPNLDLDAVYAGIEVWDDAVGAEVEFKLDLEKTDSNTRNNNSANASQNNSRPNNARPNNAGPNNASQGDNGSRRARAPRRG